MTDETNSQTSISNSGIRLIWIGDETWERCAKNGYVTATDEILSVFNSVWWATSRIRRRPAPLLAFDEVFHDSVRIGTDREAALIFDNSYARLIVERSGCSIVRKTMITSDFDTFHRYKRKAKPRFLSTISFLHEWSARNKSFKIVSKSDTRSSHVASIGR